MSSPSPLANRPFLFILVTSFLSVMGIGIVIPVLPFLIGQFVGSGNLAWYTSILIALYALCQLFAAPVLGAASDAFGRRPILLLCQFGSAIGYIAFALAGSLPLLFVGRAINGITGGDISTGFAYVADITKPEERGKYFGIIGATVGFSFIIAPSIGGLLSLVSLRAPFFAAAAITVLNMVYGYFFLPESLKPANRTKDFTIRHLNPITPLCQVLKNTRIRSILSVGLFYYFVFAVMTSIIAVFYKDALSWTAANIGVFLMLVGIGDIITQGYLAGKLSEKYGPRPLVLAGFLVTAVAFSLNIFLPSHPLIALVFVFVVVYSFGSGLFEPAYNGLISESAEPSEQGRVSGASQSVQSLSQIIGPLVGAALYGAGHSLPWAAMVILSLAGVVVVWRVIPKTWATDMVAVTSS